MIIVEYLGDVLFRDPGWVSPNCRRHPQFMPALFSKSLRFRRLKRKMWLRQVVYFDIMPYEIDGFGEHDEAMDSHIVTSVVRQRIAFSKRI